jgi:hypothetical protein
MKSLIASLIVATTIVALTVPASAGFGPRNIPVQDTGAGFGPRDLPDPAGPANAPWSGAGSSTGDQK